VQNRRELVERYKKQGKFSEAEKVLQEAFNICKNTLEFAHPHTIECLNDLARYHWQREEDDKKQHDKSARLLLNAFEMSSWLLEESQLSQEQYRAIVHSFDNATLLYRKDKREEERVKSLFQDAQTICEEKLQGDDAELRVICEHRTQWVQERGSL